VFALRFSFFQNQFPPNFLSRFVGVILGFGPLLEGIRGLLLRLPGLVEIRWLVEVLLVGNDPRERGDLDMRTLGTIWRVFVALTQDSSLGVASTRVLSVGGALSGGREEQEGTSIRIESMNLI